MDLVLLRGACAASLLAGLSLLPAVAADDASPAPSTPVDFERQIRPIFTAHCGDCHGAEAEEGGLRLHRQADAMTGGNRGAVIKPGNSAESLLIRYVSGEDPEIFMPPKDSGDPLSAEQIALLRSWIDQGAKWPVEVGDAPARVASDHWAFQPIVRAEPPEPPISGVTGSGARDPWRDWVRSPIDAFVLARLEREEIAPSPEADRVTLIRRLSFDLLGLPPTPAEVDAFVNDTRSDAYDCLVDRLLASPHFGERWGRHWLDQSRYADSDGYEKDLGRPFAWRWRDWVIDAINRDLPLNQFTVEQLAGDLLPNATLDQRIATGFHRNTLTNREGGTDKEEDRVKATVDRASTTGAVWLGLTVGCAECHSHKFDPLAQREFYGLYAFFNSVDEVDLPAPRPDELAAYEQAKAAFDAEHAPLLAAAAAPDPAEIAKRQTAWEAGLDLGEFVQWTPIKPDSVKAASKAKFSKQPDGSYLATGQSPAKDTYTVVAKLPVGDVTAIRLEVLPDVDLPGSGPGRAAKGNFVLSELTLSLASPGAEPFAVPLANPTADFAQAKYPIAGATDGDPKTGWAVGPQFRVRHAAVFEIESAAKLDADALLTLTLDQQHGKQHTIGRFRLSATTAPRPVRSNPLPDTVIEILQLPPADRNAKQQAALTAFFRTQDPELSALDRAVAEHARKAPATPGTKAQALAATSQPRATNIHIRGDFLRKGAEVKPHTFAVLPALHTRGEVPDRLDLARWLVDPANPLPGRVLANRTWQYLFGRGLVATPEDFGTRGERPSHPELLDWLATELVARRWSRKELIRLIVDSATYRQSSHTRGDLVEHDPLNILLARQNRFRLEAEIVRDLYLAASGLLHAEVGGPSVRPPQPAGISELTYANSAKWVESAGKDRYRRGLYTWFQRTSPYPMLMTFDAPDSNTCAVKRERSNTPLQALTLLNDPVFVECAQALGRRVVHEQSGGADDRIRHAFRLCMAREPSSIEAARLQELFEQLRQLAADNEQSAIKLVGAKPAGVDPPEAAAWVALARALLNLDEFVTRE